MELNTFSRLAAVGLLPITLVACGGGSSSGGSSSEPITADNALTLSQEATASVSKTGSSGAELENAFDAFGAISSSGSTAAGLQAATTGSYSCPAGGTLNYKVEESSSESVSIKYTATDCRPDSPSNVVMNGVLTITSSSSTTADSMVFELVFATGSSGFSNGICQFKGGLRYHMTMDQTVLAGGGTEYVYNYSYGATSAGFYSDCSEPPVSLAGSTEVSNVFSYTTDSEGNFVSSSSTVTASGKFVSEEGDSYTISSSGLEYASSGDSSEYGTASCPSAGSITVSDGSGGEVQVYFGEDAPEPYEVQVTGPDGFVGEYLSCEAFLNDTGAID